MKCCYSGAILALLIASPAAAQVTTTCNAVGPHLNCRSEPDSASNARDWANLGDAIRARGERKVQRDVGRLIAEGNCEGATALALRKGKLELAQYVQNICAR